MKKFLSLVLALVMTMSLVTISAGAEDFTDDASITYEEAVDVMSAIGVIGGYADGSFNPQGGLTRGAAAKIICNMILGPTTASALSADTAPYSDVAIDNTFAGYIAYCAQQGIISGYADGTFKPAAPLTGYAFWKMLLGALGYDADIEGYSQPNWSVQVAKRGLNIGLDDDLEGSFTGTKALTREEACLYAFNALQADMVEYENSSTIVVGDITVTANSNASIVANTGKTDGYIEEDGVMQFAEKYFTKLSISTKASDKVDAFGRPATTWIYDKEDVGTYADKADATLILDQKRTWTELTTGTDCFDYKASDISANVEVYVNGDEIPAATYDNNGNDYFAQGDVVEVFENDDGEVVTVAVTRYSYAKIDSVDDDLAVGLKKDGASYAIDLIDANENSLGITYYDDNDDSDLVLPGFNAEDYTEDAVIAIAMKADQQTILASHIAEAVTGTITKYKSGDKAAITIDGTAYPLNQAVENSVSTIIYEEATYGAYLDENGYVIAFDTVSTAQLEDVYYVTGVVADGNGLYNTTSYYAQAVKLIDGTVEEIKLETVSFAALLGTPITKTGNNWFVNGTQVTDGQDVGNDITLVDAVEALTFNPNTMDAVQGLYTFTDKDGNELESKSGNGKYTAEAYNHAADSAYYVRSATNLTADLARDDVSLTLSNTTFAGDNNVKKAYIDADTQYIKVEDSGDDIDVKVVTGATSVNNTYINKAITVTVKEGSNYTAKYVVLAASTFETGAADADILYIKSASTTKIAKDEWETSVVLMDGKGTTETVTTDIPGADRSFYTYTINDDGIYELDPAISNDTSSNNLYVPYYNDANGMVYDDEAGFVMAATLTNVKDNTLTGAATYDTNQTFTMEDVAISDNAVIMDSRSAAVREGDIYTAEINTVAKLKAAIDKTGTTVVANVYVEDGEVLLVNVSGSVGTPNYNQGNQSNGYALYAGQNEITALSNLSIANGQISFSDAIKLLDLDTMTTANATNVVITYTVSAWNTGAGTWNAPETVKVEVGDLAAGTDIAQSSAGTYAAGNGVSCKVDVTVACDEATFTFPTVVVNATAQ